MSGSWSIAVHGGATEIADADREAYRAGCESAIRAGAAVLAAGGSAVEATVAAVRVLEDDPTFNAGHGGARDADGRVRADAALMDGATLDVGGVAGIERVRNPVDVAAALLREEQTLLVADGAERFALARGLDGPPLGDGARDHTSPHDTVGCVARDAAGHLATAVSTGGLPGAPVGRVGDSPLPGAGFFADDEIGAVVLSGHGERIARVALAAWTLGRLADTDPVDAAAAAVRRLERVGGDVGLLVLDPVGRLGWAHSSPDFAVAWATSTTPVTSFTRADVPGGSARGSEATT
jgi:L-asparaginase / beta-aspartyl-peptidase